MPAAPKHNRHASLHVVSVDDDVRKSFPDNDDWEMKLNPLADILAAMNKVSRSKAVFAGQLPVVAHLGQVMAESNPEQMVIPSRTGRLQLRRS